MDTYISPAKIERLANEIRSQVIPASPPEDSYEVDIYSIAEALGCEVVEASFEVPQISAQVDRINDRPSKPYVIQVSASDSPRRQRFSVAHELSHIVLHDNGTDNFVERRQEQIDYDPESLYKEVQANMLASALLLPKEPICQIWRATGSVENIADIFNVSKRAAYYRIENLGLLDE